MSEMDDFMLDEELALVDYIKAALPEEMAEKIKEDDIPYFIDLVDEYCENKGLYDDDAPEEADIDMSDIGLFIAQQAAKDEVGRFTEEEAESIAELIFAFYDTMGELND